METISRYIKGCWKPACNNNANDGPRSVPPAEDESDQDHCTREESTDSDEYLALVEMAEAYATLKAEADDVWHNDVNSAIRKERSSSFEYSLIEGETRRTIIGKRIFRHASSITEIHNHFLKLDPKRCCMPTNSKKDQAFSSTGTLKTVQENDSERQRRRHIRRTQVPVIPVDVFLNEPEKSLYKRVLLCAQYPVLSAPLSEPSVTPSSFGSPTSSSSDNDVVLSPTDKIPIEPEMLMTCIRESFGVTERIHEQYCNEVRLLTPKRDPSKRLLFELQERLYQLETNQHDYYRIGSFLDREGYSKWRCRELDFTKKLIRRFWKRDIPRSLGMQVSHINAHAHEEYKMLQQKLFTYEMKTRRETLAGHDSSETISVFPVSSAAKKILKEFGLRYGVCSLYRQIASLVCMAEFATVLKQILELNGYQTGVLVSPLLRNFEYSGWYFKCVTQAVFEVKKLLQNYFEMMVKDERKMLERALRLLHDHIEYTLQKSRALFPSKMSYDSVSWILEMFKAIIKIKKDLFMWDENEDTTEKQQICSYIEKAVVDSYEKLKELAMINSGRNDNVATPRILRCLLHDIRKELDFYKEFEKECSDISRYLDVMDVVSKKLYSMLMKDVRTLFVQRTMNASDGFDVDGEVLGLAYLLSDLDQDWGEYIAPSLQKWRIYFMMEMKRTMTLTSASTNKLVRKFIEKDALNTIEFDIPQADEKTIKAVSRGTLREDSSSIFSNQSSVIQSETSAFEKIQPRSTSNNSKNRTNTNESSASENKPHSHTTSLSETSVSPGSSNMSRKTMNSENEEMASCGKVGKKESIPVIEGRNGSSLVSLEQNQIEEKRIKLKKNLVIIQVDNREKQGDCTVQKTCSKELVNGSSGSSYYETPSEGSERSQDFRYKSIISAESHYEDALDARVDTEGFIKDLLDEILCEVTYSADERIDIFVQEVLVNAIDSLKTNQTCGNIVIPKEKYDETADKKGNLNFTQVFQGDTDNPVTVRPKPRKVDIAKEKSTGIENTQVNGIILPKPEEDEPVDSQQAFLGKNVTVDNSGRENEKYSSKLSKDIAPAAATEPHHCDNGTAAPDYENRTDEFPERGQILISSSLVDTLVTILRVSGFYSNLCDLLVPSSSHEKFVADLSALGDEHELFRGHVFNGLLLTIKEVLLTYGDGILALDVCGWEDEDLDDILDAELVERLRQKQKNGLISGCRHDPYRRMSENARLEGQRIDYCPHMTMVLRYCIGEWESISGKSCLRLNNIRALLDLLKPIELGAKKACGISLHNADTREANITEDEIKVCQRGLQAIWTSQLNILAERVVTMFGRIVDLLLSLSLKWTKNAPYKEQLKPVSVFLEAQMDILRKNLYPRSLREVVKEIWQRILRLFNGYADELKVNRTNPCGEAKRYIQLMSICLKHLVVDDYTGDKLISRCSPVLLRFQFYFYSPDQLKLVSDISKIMANEGWDTLLSLNAKETLRNMRTAGGLPRVFSGAEFVDKISSNHVWLQGFGVEEQLDVQEQAVFIGDMLLQRQMIGCVETPDSKENGVRIVTREQSFQGKVVVKIESTRFSLVSDSGDNSSESSSNSDSGDADSLSDTSCFKNSPNYFYKINIASCNIRIWDRKCFEGTRIKSDEIFC